jgi:two-component system response regulator DctR
MKNGLVFVVDDEEPVRDALGWLLSTRGLTSRAYASAESFLAGFESDLARHDGPCCALLDVRMGGMSGLQLFGELRRRPRAAALRVIFLTGHGDVPMAVAAVKQGAFDFFEKPFSDNTLVDRVLEALADSERALASQREHDELARRFAQLTARELEVARLVVAGQLNKVIADKLGVSIRTVETHRANALEKLGVRSAAELASLMARFAPRTDDAG